jgi:hypothetical protein
VRRDRHAGRSRDGGGPQPSRDAADAHEIRHHEIARSPLQGIMQLAATIEVLTHLDRRLEIGREPGVAVEVVIDDRFLDPRQTQIVDHMAALQGVAEI